MLTQEYANWSPTNGLVVSHGTEKYERRSLSGVQIRVGSLEVGDLTHFGKKRIQKKICNLENSPNTP